MNDRAPRRNFLKRSAVVGTLAGLGDFAFLPGLPHLAAADVQLAPGRVRLSADIEPLVRLLEDTERKQILETVAERMRRGATYQDLMTALMLAGVRGIQPRPVGFKFHAVLVVHSAHLASLAANDRDRWLPLFWAIDTFKASQERNRKEGDWSMRELPADRLPAAHLAGARFREAMAQWDADAADAGITAWSRNAGQSEIYEVFWRLGARDFRDIGHKAIYVANSYRTLQTIGWRHAEPILRSLAYALVAHEETNPAKRDDFRDRPGRDNLNNLLKVRRDWQQGKPSAAAAGELLQAMRTLDAAAASLRVIEMLNKEISPASIWDGLFLFAGELLMRQPGIVGLHCVTTINALYFGYQTSGDDVTRRYLLLQAAAFLSLFRQRMGKLPEDLRLDAIQPAELKAQGTTAIEEIFHDADKDRLLAARKALTLATREPDRIAELMAASRRLIFARGTDSHDYKFSSAVFEDFTHVTPDWRNRFLASSLFYLRSAGAETDLTRRIRAALGAK